MILNSKSFSRTYPDPSICGEGSEEAYNQESIHTSLEEILKRTR